MPDDGIPMDFHAYAEIWLEGGWQVFDPHDSFPRKGRVFLASGLDAADAAFATLYGGARLTSFQVWADPIPLDESLDRRQEPRLPSPAAAAAAVPAASDAPAHARAPAAAAPFALSLPAQVFSRPAAANRTGPARESLPPVALQATDSDLRSPRSGDIPRGCRAKGGPP